MARATDSAVLIIVDIPLLKYSTRSLSGLFLFVCTVTIFLR